MPDRTIVIDFEAGTAKFVSGVEQAGHAVEGVKEHAEEATPILEKFQEGFELAGGFEAFDAGVDMAREKLEQIKEAFEETSNIGKDALKLGVSAEDMSRFQHAANATSTDVGVLSSGIEHLNRTIGQVSSGDQSAGAASEAIKKLGLDAAELATMNPSEAFQKVSQAVAGMEQPFERAEVVQEIFGRGGTELLPIMEHLNDLMRESDDIGFTRTPEQIEKVEQEERKLAAITDQIKAGLMDLAASDFSMKLVDGFKKAYEEAHRFMDVINPAGARDRRTERINQGISRDDEYDRQSQEALKGSFEGKSLDERIEKLREYVRIEKEQLEGRKELLELGAKGISFNDLRETQLVLAAEQHVLDIMLQQKKAADEIAAAKAAQAAKDASIADEAKKTIDGLEDRIQTFGMDEADKKLYELRKAGMKENDPLYMQAKGDAGYLDRLEGNKKAREDISRLESEIAEKSGHPIEPPALDADDKYLEKLKELRQQLKDAEEQQKRIDEAKHIWAEAETALQKYNDKLAEMKDLLAHGALTQEQFAQAKAKADQELAKSEHEGMDHKADLISRRTDFRMPEQKGSSIANQQLDVIKQQFQYIQTWDQYIRDMWTATTQQQQQPVVFANTGVA